MAGKYLRELTVAPSISQDTLVPVSETTGDQSYRTTVDSITEIKYCVSSFATSQVLSWPEATITWASAVLLRGFSFGGGTTVSIPRDGIYYINFSLCAYSEGTEQINWNPELRIKSNGSIIARSSLYFKSIYLYSTSFIPVSIITEQNSGNNITCTIEFDGYGDYLQISSTEALKTKLDIIRLGK